MVESALKRWNKGLAGTGNFTGHFLLLVVRLYWGVLFIRFGFMKLLDWDNTVSTFTHLGIPFPVVVVIIICIFEVLGGVSWILGLFTRLFAIPLFAITVIAYLSFFLNALTAIFSDPFTFTAAKPFLFLYASLILFCFGAGFISLDYRMSTSGKKGK